MENEKEEMLEHKKKLIVLRRQLCKDLEKAPEGRLRISDKGKYKEFYHCNEGPGTSGMRGKYLKKRDLKLIRELAQKDYDNRLLKEVTSQIVKIENCSYEIGTEYLRNVYESLPEIRKSLVVPRVKSPEDATEAAVAEWLAIPYDPKGFEEGAPEIYTDAGERVRSKSEKLIAEKLRLMGIPYRYECPLILVGYGVVHPDFTILNKNTMKVYYLEHLGKMDDPDYATRNIAKVRSYERTGIYVGKNLFLTMETRQEPFDARCIEQMFEDFI